MVEFRYTSLTRKTKTTRETRRSIFFKGDVLAGLLDRIGDGVGWFASLFRRRPERPPPDLP